MIGGTLAIVIRAVKIGRSGHCHLGEKQDQARLWKNGPMGGPDRNRNSVQSQLGTRSEAAITREPYFRSRRFVNAWMFLFPAFESARSLDGGGCHEAFAASSEQRSLVQFARLWRSERSSTILTEKKVVLFFTLSGTNG